MNIADRLQVLQDLYERGFLCKCWKWTPERFEKESELLHEKTCEAKRQVLELLKLPDKMEQK